MEFMLTEFYVDDPEYIVKVSAGLRDVAVITEPLSVPEKGIIQAFEIQRRLKVWQPKKSCRAASVRHLLHTAVGSWLRGFPPDGA